MRTEWQHRFYPSNIRRSHECMRLKSISKDIVKNADWRLKSIWRQSSWPTGRITPFWESTHLAESMSVTGNVAFWFRLVKILRWWRLIDGLMSKRDWLLKCRLSTNIWGTSCAFQTFGHGILRQWWGKPACEFWHGMFGEPALRAQCGIIYGRSIHASLSFKRFRKSRKMSSQHIMSPLEGPFVKPAVLNRSGMLSSASTRLIAPTLYFRM